MGEIMRLHPRGVGGLLVFLLPLTSALQIRTSGHVFDLTESPSLPSGDSARGRDLGESQDPAQNSVEAEEGADEAKRVAKQMEEEEKEKKAEAAKAEKAMQQNAAVEQNLEAQQQATDTEVRPCAYRV